MARVPRVKARMRKGVIVAKSVQEIRGELLVISLRSMVTAVKVAVLLDRSGVPEDADGCMNSS